MVAAAGDIACDPGDPDYNGGAGTSSTCRQRYTSDLLINQGFDRILTLGDHQYENETYSKYLQVFDPTWGRVKDLISPIPGNREYRTAGAAGYFDYFNGVAEENGAAGERGKGYYSYDIGTWHIIALNSNCSVVSCAVGSPQHTWLESDLAANPRACTLAYFHHPRFSSGSAGNATSVAPFWQSLFDAGVDVILTSHAHGYERFAPQTPSGTVDTARGIRQFVVGTGGRSLHSFTTNAPNTEVRDNTTYGILRMTLRPNSYDWAFVPEGGTASFRDSGSHACH